MQLITEISCSLLEQESIGTTKNALWHHWHVQQTNLLCWDGVCLEKALPLGRFTAKASALLWQCERDRGKSSSLL